MNQRNTLRPNLEANQQADIFELFFMPMTCFVNAMFCHFGPLSKTYLGKWQLLNSWFRIRASFIRFVGGVQDCLAEGIRIRVCVDSISISVRKGSDSKTESKHT